MTSRRIRINQRHTYRSFMTILDECPKSYIHCAAVAVAAKLRQGRFGPAQCYIGCVEEDMVGHLLKQRN